MIKTKRCSLVPETRGFSTRTPKVTVSPVPGVLGHRAGTKGHHMSAELDGCTSAAPVTRRAWRHNLELEQKKHLTVHRVRPTKEQRL